MSEVTSIFDLKEYEQYKAAWDARNTEMRRRKGYADGSIYTKNMNRLGWIKHRFKGSIRPLYLPLSKAVNVDAGIVPGGWTLTEETSDDVRDAIKTVMRMSRWRTDGVLYVHYGATYGPVGIKVVDLREENKIVLNAIEPTKYMLIYDGEYDESPSMALQVEHFIDFYGRYEYAEVTTPDAIYTYRDGKLHGYGGREPEYANLQGVVNYVECIHMLDGSLYGQCTFQDAIEMLTEVNRTASQLGDIIEKHAEPQWAASGVEPSELFKSGDVVWYMPENGQIKPLVAPIDIKGVLEFIREIANNVKEALPEKAFEELRTKDQIATASLEIQLMDLVLKVQRVRPNYDEGLERALRMAGNAAADMGLDLAVLASDDWGIDPKRPILPLDPLTQINIEMQRIQLERERGMMIGEGLDGSQTV
jgi:hypothetical protein